MPDPNDKTAEVELIRRIIEEGDTLAFNTLIEPYMYKMNGLLSKCGIDQDQDREDIIQDSLVQIWKALDGFDQSRSFYSWVMAIAANKARDFLRKLRRDKWLLLGEFCDIPSDDEPLSEESELDTDSEKKVTAIKDIIKKRPPMNKDIFISLATKAKKAKELARTYRKSTDNIYQIKLREKQHIQEKLRLQGFVL